MGTRTRWFLGLVALVGALAPTAAIADTRRVPDVVGQSRAEATAALAERGFIPATIEIAGNPPDTVARQEPAAGVAAPTGSPVTIFVRRAVAVTTVAPNAVGLTVTEANAALGSVYLLELEEVAGSPGARGRVLEQDPAAGASLEFRGTLTLRFSPDARLPRTVVVPDLLGLSAAEAQTAASEAGLHARIAQTALAGAPPDVAIAQRPAAGTEVERYSTVDVVISTGGGEAPAPSRVPVPNLTDLTESSARADLEAAGLVAAVEWIAGDPSRAFLVDAQHPAPGTIVETGSTVRLRIVRWTPPAPPTPPPPEQTVVPNLIGRTQHQAEAMLAAVGLGANPVLLPHPTAPAFRVFGQQSAPHSLVSVGTTVTFRVARPPPPPAPVPVPNFFLRTRAQAVSMAALAGLALDVDFVDAPTRPPGRVFAQSIAAGRDVPLGTNVTVRVARHTPGPATATVPDLHMKTAAQAAALLAAASLGADPHQVVNPARPPFRVYDQTPAAGASVPVGSVVQYTIARPAGGGLRTVPDLVGNTQGQASIEVATAGLTIDFDHVSTGAHPAGRVYAQSPAAGSSVPAGTVVRARVATPAGPATVAVPNLIGLASGAARAALEARGLVSDGRVVLRPDKPLHRVYSQSRVAGSHVAPGTTIRWRANP